MPQMAQPTAAEDPRLWAVSYIEFLVTEDEESRLLLERDARYMAAAMGNFAFYLMDAVYLPVRHGVRWWEPWVEIDSLRRTNPSFRTALARRDAYRHLGRGYTLRPKRRLRRTAADVVTLVWLAHQAERYPYAPVRCDAQGVLEMLAKYREMFFHLSDVPGNA
jgi:hypothetical protein